jgi:hypothetical protein
MQAISEFMKHHRGGELPSNLFGLQIELHTQGQPLVWSIYPKVFGFFAGGGAIGFNHLNPVIFRAFSAT